MSGTLLEQLEEPLRVEWRSARSKRLELHPTDDERVAAGFNRVDLGFLVERAIDEIGRIDKDDLVACAALKGEHRLADPEEVEAGDLCAELFLDLSTNRGVRILSEFDPPSRGTEELLFLYAVEGRSNENLGPTPEDTDRFRTDSRHGDDLSRMADGSAMLGRKITADLGHPRSGADTAT